jgi:hypothetical protein
MPLEDTLMKNVKKPTKPVNAPKKPGIVISTGIRAGAAKKAG